MRTVNEIGNGVSQDTNKLPAIEFDLLDLLLILSPRKRMIFLFSLAGLLIAFGLATLVQPMFTAKAAILPPEQEQSSSSALLGQVGTLASLSGMSTSLGLKAPEEIYLGILKSETVADALIKQFDLMKLYHAKRQSQARSRLAGRSKFQSGKDGLIVISVKDHDPHRAAAMANAYVDQLYQMNTRLAFSSASQRRLFFEQQLAEEKDRLADAEVALEKTEESTGVISPSGQMATIIRQIAQLRADITSHEVELDALRTSSTEQNSDVIRLTTELNSMRGQLRDLESKRGKHESGDIAISSASAPQVGLEYIRKERDVKYHQLLFELLARQYEAARLDEAKNAPVIQVVDPALTPDRKSGPFRALWAFIGGFLGFLMSCSWVVGSYIYHRMEGDRDQGPRLHALRQALRIRG